MTFRLNPRENWLFLIFLMVGTAMRAMALVAYRPALLLQSDAYVYLQKSLELEPSHFRPVLYSIFLKPFVWAHSLLSAVMVQHLLGLGLAVLLYVYLRRLEIGPILSALGPAPLLLDAYQVNIEHYILAETLFQVLSVGALLTLMWRPPTTGRSMVAGILIALSALTRFLGLVLLLPAAIYIWKRVGWRSSVAMCAATAVPLLAYAVWFSSVFGTFAITDREGSFLYGRVAHWVDCDDLHVPSHQRVLCDRRPIDERPNPNRYVFGDTPPGGDLRLPPGQERDDVLRDFAISAIEQQPLSYVGVVGRGMLHYFAPVRSTGRHDNRLDHWRFPSDASDTEPHAFLIRKYRASPPPAVDPARFRIAQGPAAILRAYQSTMYMHGPLLLICLVVAVAPLIAWRRDPDVAGARPAILLLTGASFLLLLIPVATVTFDYRFMLMAHPMLPVGAALGADLIRRKIGGTHPAGEPRSPATSQDGRTASLPRGVS